MPAVRIICTPVVCCVQPSGVDDRAGALAAGILAEQLGDAERHSSGVQPQTRDTTSGV